MLSNAYFLANFRFDTAENEPAKICNEYLVQNSRVFEKRLPRSSLLEGFAKGFCKCKCFANPLARRMVRELKEKDDGGTTGGLSSAGTPHNNFCVHPAVHFRQGGGVEGNRGVGSPDPLGRSAKIVSLEKMTPPPTPQLCQWRK